MINKISNSLLSVALGSLILTGSVLAQTATGSTPGARRGAVDPGHPRVNQVNRRESRQQNRIANGVRNGSLSPQEASRLEKREARLQRTERKDMAEHNGHLTKPEQRQLNRRENRISRSIYRDKHN